MKRKSVHHRNLIDDLRQMAVRDSFCWDLRDSAAFDSVINFYAWQKQTEWQRLTDIYDGGSRLLLNVSFSAL